MFIEKNIPDRSLLILSNSNKILFSKQTTKRTIKFVESNKINFLAESKCGLTVS